MAIEGRGIRTIIDMSGVTTQNHEPLNGRHASLIAIIDAYDHKVFMDHKEVNFRDSRNGGLANVDLMKGLVKQQVFDGIAWIRQNYLGEKFTGIPTVAQMQHMTMLAQAIPAFLLNRAESIFTSMGENALPDFVGDLYQVARGSMTVAYHQQQYGLKGPNDDSLLGEDLYQVANGIAYGQQSTLVNPGDGTSLPVVCPASPAMIAETLNVFILGRGGNAIQSELGELIPDFQQLLRFAQAYENVVTILKQLGPKINAFRDSMLRRRIHDDTLLQAHIMPEVSKLQELQDTINEILGRNFSDAPRVIPNDILEILFV